MKCVLHIRLEACPNHTLSHRWQTAGTFAISEDGKIKWGGPSQRSDDVADFEEAVQALSK